MPLQKPSCRFKCNFNFSPYRQYQLKLSRAYKASEIISEAHRQCFAKVRPVWREDGCNFSCCTVTKVCWVSLFSFPWIWQQPHFQKRGPKTWVHIRTWKQVLLRVWFLSWLLKDVQLCNYIMYLPQVMTTTGPQMFTSTRMPTCRKWEMGVGLVVTIDVVNLPLTLFGEGEGEDVKMRLSFNLLCAFYLPSNFLKKFHLLEPAPFPPSSPYNYSRRRENSSSGSWGWAAQACCWAEVVIASKEMDGDFWDQSC